MQESVLEQTFSLLGSYRFENGSIEISSAYYYVDPMEWLYDGDYVPVRTRWDFRIGKRFPTREIGNRPGVHFSGHRR